MSDISNEKIKEKITKLFALANNNPSQEEAQAALLKAQELLAKYELAEDECGEKSSRVVICRKLEESLADWREILWSALAKHFQVYPCISYNKYGGKRYFQVFGYEEHVNTFSASAVYIAVAFDRLWHDYLKQLKKGGYRGTNGESRMIRNQYLLGFLDGMKSAFAKQETALAIITAVPQEVLDSLPHMKHNKRVSNIKINSRDVEAREKGFTDGAGLRDNVALV